MGNESSTSSGSVKASPYDFSKSKNMSEVAKPSIFLLGGGILCTSIGSKIIVDKILENERPNDSKKKKRNEFVLGCTLVGVGLNLLSYYSYPKKEMNVDLRLDAVRRSGLWALYGCGVGLGVGHILFGT